MHGPAYLTVYYFAWTCILKEWLDVMLLLLELKQFILLLDMAVKSIFTYCTLTKIMCPFQYALKRSMTVFSAYNYIHKKKKKFSEIKYVLCSTITGNRTLVGEYSWSCRDIAKEQLNTTHRGLSDIFCHLVLRDKIYMYLFFFE